MADDAVQQPEDTQPPAGEAVSEPETPPTPTASAEEIAQLRRDAAQAKASQRRADELTTKLARFEEAERTAQLAAAGEDGKLQVELDQAKRDVIAARRDAALANLKAEYPDAYKRLGEHAADLPVETVAALQADLASPAGTEPPTPRLNNPPKDGSAPQPPKEKTSDEIVADLAAMGVPTSWQ